MSDEAQASTTADLTKTEEVEPVRADRSKPRVKPDDAEKVKRQLAASKGARTKLLALINRTRDDVRTTRMPLSERQAAHAVVQDGLADLARLDKRIFWLEHPSTPKPQDDVQQ